MINIGDIVFDKFNNKYIVFEKDEANHMNPEPMYFVVDYATHDKGDYLAHSQIHLYETKPKNLRWLFIEKRKRTTKKNALLMFTK